ncbi:MAG: valine--tRNA ligase [Candidatus Omnitrophota bacterium]
MIELPKVYTAKEVEDKWYKDWEEKRLFSAKINSSKKPFCVVIPPPNVTGILHMGHALNNTIQDILIRYHRMKGEEALWMPGTDHAGIATQNVVERSIAKSGLKRQDLGREKFLEKVWLWKEQYGATIIGQLKKLGASCDWDRARFTMDEDYSGAVKEVFVKLYEKGLIYQGSYIINWCPRCQTALADEEAPHHDLQGSLYYLKYPFKDNPDKFITVATTRPETMLGDTAVAVNPKDNRYKKFIGKILILPLVNREIKIIADSVVDKKFGTGAVKVTPAHDPNDYAMGKKHGLEFINVMYPDGRMNEAAGDYKDMDRFEAREVIVEDLREKGLLEKTEPHALSAGHCYRCHTIIEPYLSKQWFVKMKPLAEPAIKAVKDGRIKFYPGRWKKVYLNWMENIQDWCVSRQIWWGHRLPVYYCRNCIASQSAQSPVPSPQSPVLSCQLPVPSLQSSQLPVPSPQSPDKPETGNLKPETGNLKLETGNLGEGALGTGDLATGNPGIIVSRCKPDTCPTCGSNDIYQDEDVLDTWFSSWLWPFATFGWPFYQPSAISNQPSAVSCQLSAKPEKLSVESKKLTADSRKLKAELAYFYPTSTLVTAPEIIFFWVARMIMAGFEFMGDIPFKDVYIHGTVRDIEGKKMSKSLGNVIDPLEIINEYGTDALRFSLISITSQGQDVFLSKERFEQGRNFANKIWNAARFVLMNLENEAVKTDLCVFFAKSELDLANRWILSRFYSTLKELNKNIEAYKFNEAANLLYHFFWHEYCDWYLEMIKQDIKSAQNQVVMYKVLEKFLRAIHPFMPFITEEIWQKISPDSGSIMINPRPHIQEQIIDKKIESAMGIAFEIITGIRNMRAEMEIAPSLEINVIISSGSKNNRQIINSLSPHIKKLARLNSIVVEGHFQQLKSAFTTLVNNIHITILLEGVVDIEKELIKLDGKIKKAENDIKAKQATLNNKNFVDRAPVEIVEKEKSKLKELEETLHKLKEVKHGLQ